MAKTPHRKRTPNRLRTAPVELEETDDRTDTEQDILAALEAPEHGVTHQINVYQLQSKGSGNPEEFYLFEISAADLPGLWDRLRDTPELGTGKYRVRVRRNEDGRSVQIHQMDRAIKSLTPPAPAITAAPDGLLQRLDRLEQLLARPAAATPAIDLVAMFGVFNQMQANLIASHPPAAAPASTVDPMEMFRSGVEFAREIGAPGEKGIGDVVTALLSSPIMDKLTQAVTPAAAAAPAALPARAPPPVIQQYLFELVAELGEQAKKNVDVFEASEYVFENAPIAMIRRICNDPALLDQLAAALPVVASYRGFFTALREELRRGMMPPDGETPPGAPGEPAGESNGRDTGNAEVDAPARS